MKTCLLVSGIVCLVAAAFALLFAFLNIYMYYNLLDGSSGQYAKIHKRAVVFLIVGIIAAAAGTACIIIQTKI